MPGRLTPGSNRIRNCAAATHAPVLPAEITTSASPLAASLHITAMLLSGLLRIASTGDSSIAMTCVVGMILYRLRCSPVSVEDSIPAADGVLVAHEQNHVPITEKRRGLPASLQDFGGSMVPAHHIHRNSHRHSPSIRQRDRPDQP